MKGFETELTPKEGSIIEFVYLDEVGVPNINHASDARKRAIPTDGVMGVPLGITKATFGDLERCVEKGEKGELKWMRNGEGEVES